MATQITVKHTGTGLIKSAPVGFSWTTLFFGGFPALLRGDIKWAVIMWLAGAGGGFFAIITVGVLFFLPWVFWLLFAFTYNKKYITDLLSTGFVPADEHSSNMLAQAGIAVARQSTSNHSADRDSAGTPKNIETAILSAAKQRGGVVTASLLAMEGDYGMDEAKQALDEMVNAGHAELRVRKTGETVYAFPEMLSDDNREDLESMT